GLSTAPAPLERGPVVRGSLRALPRARLRPGRAAGGDLRSVRHRPGRRPERRVRGEHLRRAAARRRPGGGRAAGRAEQLLAAGPAGRTGPAAVVRRTGRGLPGVRPAGGWLAHRETPARRGLPRPGTDDPTAR